MSQKSDQLGVVSQKSDLLGVVSLNQYSALLNNTSSQFVSKLCPSILKSNNFEKEEDILADIDDKQKHAETSNQTHSSILDWNDSQCIKRKVARQNKKTTNENFDPFSYFGAIDMPIIDSEDQPAHPRIEKIFKSKKQREIDDILRLASTNGKKKHQKFRNPATTPNSNHKPTYNPMTKYIDLDTQVHEIPLGNDVQLITENISSQEHK